jgi:cytochrome c-type biogenesis protein CcmH/NrfG
VTEAVEEREEREELEARREFLIRSLADLEAERDAGNIDDETYDRLHGDYTARAAAVLRELDGEKVTASPEAPAVPAGRRALVIGAVVAFAVAAAVVLGITISPRLPGQTVTGGVTTTPQQTAAALKQATIDHPNDYRARIAYARSLLSSDPVGALKQYTAAGRLEPSQPEPPTYIGWIFALSSQEVTDPTEHAQLISRALEELATAHRVDPKYADAYAFDGLVHSRFENDPKGAIPLLKKYVQLAPDGPEVALVRGQLASAQKAAKSPAGATTTTTGS